MAGLAGALVPRGGPLPKFNDKSGAAVVVAPGAETILHYIIPETIVFSHYMNKLKLTLKTVMNYHLPGGGGMLGGPPCGIGCCCNGGGFVGGVTSFGSISSHSEDKSPELNLKQITIYTDID